MTDPAYKWLFVRGADALTLERSTSVSLAVSSSTGDRQVHDFGSEIQLLEFQLRLHRHLIETGWGLDDFFPERRSNTVDRRRTRASAPDRRVLPWPVRTPPHP
jgi:hypothetical protein